MLQKDIGKALLEKLGRADSLEEMNQFVFSAMRRLDEINKPDFEALELALEEAKEAHWTSLLWQELTNNGTGREQIIKAAEELKNFVETMFLPVETPTKTHMDISKALKGKFGFK